MRDEFKIVRNGKQFVLFAGLLDEAHTRGLRSIDTELLQAPTAENANTAIVKATARVILIDHATGEVRPDPKTKEPIIGVFSGIGDASPQNVGRQVASHLIRMAETRAKARALRGAVNVGAIALEEISLGGEEKPQGAASQAAPAAPVRSIDDGHGGSSTRQRQRPRAASSGRAGQGAGQQIGPEEPGGPP